MLSQAYLVGGVWLWSLNFVTRYEIIAHPCFLYAESCKAFGLNHFNQNQRQHIKSETKFCKAKELSLKKQLQEKYKIYRNQIVTLTQVCKENYYQYFLENNKTNLKKIWKGIRSILSMKNNKANNKYSLLIAKALTTNEKDIANHFNTFFTCIVQKLVEKIPPKHNNFKNYLKNQNEMSFIWPADIKETENIISSPQENKASGPNSLPIKILKVSKKWFSVPLTYLINLALKLGFFLKF